VSELRRGEGCGLAWNKGLHATLPKCDHSYPPPLSAVIPRAQGGADHPRNFTVACSHCNGAKGARTPAEWADARYSY
jgi:5-methylcytosine-specific restriction endonuclease McrA